MHVRTRQISRWLSAALVVAAVAAPPALATSPDDRPFYRGGTPDLAPASQSPDDRPFYRGGSDISAPSSPSPDDRPFARMSEASLGAGSLEATSATGFDWRDAAIGGTFGVALAVAAAAAAVVANQRRRSLRGA